MSDKRLKGRIEELENTLREILHFCNHLHNDCKYNLNDGHIRKIKKYVKENWLKLKMWKSWRRLLMVSHKVYRCCICHKVLEDYKPIRLVKQLHDNKETYGAYHNKANYDFCKSCYAIFNNWIVKHKEVENDKSRN